MKTNSIIRLFILAMVGICVASVISAGSRVNPRKGKAYFKKHCRVCHDGASQEAPTLQPVTKTMDQWTRTFADEGDVKTCLPRVKEKVDSDLTGQDLLDIQAYLVQHAADSDQPATCGQD
jgi:cytochrome c